MQHVLVVRLFRSRRCVSATSSIPPGKKGSVEKTVTVPSTEMSAAATEIARRKCASRACDSTEPVADELFDTVLGNVIQHQELVAASARHHALRMSDVHARRLHF